MKPLPIKAFEEQHEKILKYVESIKNGRIPFQKDSTDCYYVLDVLKPYDLSSVSKHKNGIIVFTFRSLPCNSTPLLIYSPNNQADLRKVSLNGGNALIKGEMLERCWFYCEADFE